MTRVELLSTVVVRPGPIPRRWRAVLRFLHGAPDLEAIAGGELVADRLEGRPDLARSTEAVSTRVGLTAILPCRMVSRVIVTGP